ncbi:MAG: LemA family protein [Alphaproteobacteria bacterium]|nr:MAG: LemA family protein [Alphaproteobacteria bacterium]
MIAVYVVIGLAVLVIGYVIVTYNGLVRLRQRVNNAWSDIDVQLKRRYNLVPNLVETVKGYATHEKSTLDAVVRARNEAVANTGTPAQQAASETVLAGALKSLFALAESYPDLKANKNFADLQRSLGEIEDHIQAARRYYNAAAREMNTRVEQFPSNLVARQFGFGLAEYFEIEEDAARAPVMVEF